MLKFLLLSFLSSSVLFSLELNISKGMENNTTYSVLNLFDKSPFLCELQKNNLGIPHEVICSFSKLPVEPFKNVENEFFQVIPKRLKNNFFIIIKAKRKIQLYPIIFNLVQDKEIFQAQTQMSKRWIVIGYDKEIPYIKELNEAKKSVAISFPAFIEFDELPYVGGLDLQGNPVHIKNTTDVRSFVEVKKLFMKKKYEDCIDTIDTILQNYPHTLFRSELIYYKIKSFYKLRNYDSVIDLSKEFLREYSSSENVPEILLLDAVSYYKNGQYSDADYFFDRLFSEHYDSKYAKKGYIYKGDMAVDSGENKKAEKFYKKALSDTKDIDIALLAAFRLAQMYQQSGKYSLAGEYVERILQTKDNFFYNHYTPSKEMMINFAEEEKYTIAAKIDKAILKYMNKKEDDYEVNLKNLGLWLAKTSKKQEAIKALDKYIKEFPDGDYIEDIQKVRDSLFFDIKDKNVAKLLEKYDQLIQTYKDDPIGEKALYEKAKLMLKKKMFSDILQIKEQILALDEEKFPKKDQIVHQAILGLMENALEHKECGLVLKIQEENNISIDSKWDDGLYNCFIKAGEYQQAKKIALRDVKTKDLQQKEKWLYRYAKVSFATGNYTEAIAASKDLLAMVEDIKKSPYKDIYRVLFDAYDRVGNFDAMVQTIQKIENLFGLHYKDIDRYVDMINVGVDKKDDNIIIKYGKKLYDLQKRINSFVESPFVEFALYQAYMNKGQYKEALEVISRLDHDKELTTSQRARQQYLKGVVLDKLWRNEEARKAYQMAIKADKESAWGKLAQSALELE